ncbi:hypothetical protein F5883DRAFT_518701 [Diaporthe sp. PMI_573]|nr:hypothetical protein F5883DRAFT_518701 [Diaporthaceae sp. PMI_573]
MAESMDIHTSPVEVDEKESEHPHLPHQIATHSGEHKADSVTFFGFTPMRKRLSGDAVDFLLNHERWAKTEDCPRVVSQKNVIMMFTIHAEIEDSLCRVPIGPKVDKSKPLGLLQQLLGSSYMKGPRAYTFALAILKAYTNSRHEQIVCHLFRGEWPPEPEEPIDKVLLSAVDRRLVFMFTRQPLHCLPVSSPHLRLEHHRLKLERLLSDGPEVEKVFTKFMLLVPQVNKQELVKPWHNRRWIQAQELTLGRKFNLPQTSDAPDLEIMWATAGQGSEFRGAGGDYIDLRTQDMAAAIPDGYSVSGGLYMYNLGVRLACNYISAFPAPDDVNTFTNAVFTSIELFAKDLEGHLEAHTPNWAGQYQPTSRDDIAPITILMEPAGIHKVLQISFELVLSRLDSEDFGLAQWSWLATEVQHGKAAIQTAHEEVLSRNLHHGSNPNY